MPGWQNDRVENQANDDIPHDDHPSLGSPNVKTRVCFRLVSWPEENGFVVRQTGLHVLEESAGAGGR
jgi:hypothetical protein